MDGWVDWAVEDCVRGRVSGVKGVEWISISISASKVERKVKLAVAISIGLGVWYRRQGCVGSVWSIS